MTTSELAAKIAEEVFRTIEREKAIIKADIVDAVEKVLALEQMQVYREAQQLSPSYSQFCGLPPGQSLVGTFGERHNPLAAYKR